MIGKEFLLMLMEEKCAILDCGGQYTKVIDRKVRELGVKSEIFPIGVSPEKLKGFGGPAARPAFGKRVLPNTMNACLT